MFDLFKTKNIEQHADALAQYLPDGPLFRAKGINLSNLRQLLLGLAHETKRVDDKLNEVAREHNIFLTEALLPEWESAVGIPDDSDIETPVNVTTPLPVRLFTSIAAC